MDQAVERSAIERFFFPTWRAVLAAVVSALLLTGSYPPWQLGGLAWFALVPLLLAAYGRRRSTTYVITLAWAAACVVSSTDLYFWQRSPVFVGILLASAVVQTVLVAEILIFAQRFKRWGWVLIAVLWTGSLFAIGRLLPHLPQPLPPSMPFISIANSQWLSPRVFQILPVTGESGLVFLILLVNAGLVETLRSVRSPDRRWLPAALALALVLVDVVWGGLQLAGPAAPRTVGVAILPHASYLDVPKAVSKTRGFMQAVASSPVLLPNGSPLPKTDLLVWDENPVGYLAETSAVTPVGDLAREMDLYLVADYRATQAGSPPLNVAVVFGPDGALLARNAKKVIPLIVEQSAPGDRRSPPEIVTTPWGRMTTLICYETLFPDLVRGIAGHGVDLLAVPAHALPDASRASSIHLSQTIFRAVENHTAIAFSYASGVSALIDARGRLVIHGPFPALHTQLRPSTAMVSALPVGGGGTLYTRVGDLFGWAVLLLGLGWIGYGRLVGRRAIVSRIEAG